MFKVGDVIDGAYLVAGTCSDSGGMGVILFVDELAGSKGGTQLVLKYCRGNDDESLKRFRQIAKSFVPHFVVRLNRKILARVDCLG